MPGMVTSEMTNVGAGHAVPEGAERARLVLTGRSPTSPRQVVRKAG